jgi:hypothetical protein
LLLIAKWRLLLIAKWRFLCFIYTDILRRKWKAKLWAMK